ncbi:MAG: D-alanine--D-alanine ligase family protein [Bdellovibrionales bacterium]
MKNKVIALIYKDKGFESEISAQTSQAIEKVFKELSYSYFLVPADKNLFQVLLDKKPDLAFLAVHGPYGEDGCLQGICEMLSIPYTGSGVLTSSICMDKIFFKKYCIQNQIATPDFFEISEENTSQNITQYPVVIKASHGGSTLGTSIVKDKKNLELSIENSKKIGRFVFAEDYISGQEVAVSYLDGQILTPLEIVPKGGFYDYKRKYEKGLSEYHIPAKLDPFVLEKIKNISEKVFSLLNVRGYGRADFLVENKKTPWLLEVNTLPGLTQTSLLPKSAAHDKISFQELIQKIINCATRDYAF